MADPSVPQVDCEQVHPGFAVSEVLAAVEFYTKKLGFRLAFTWGEPPTFAGVILGHVEVFLQQGTPNPKGSSVYFALGCADASAGSGTDELYEYHRGNGVEIVHPPADREYGIRDYTVRDLYGYYLTFGEHLLNAGPPLEIERVDVPVRLEKRLAGLLHDLAEHKHMDVNQCLEEMLLHTCEPLGDGVASPHTKKTLRYIQELKKKHGIDYDCHASYRFVEK
jgi:catechol 2,3-dioxygenase-like lactoylglutathione lyase family enzyme